MSCFFNLQTLHCLSVSKIILLRNINKVSLNLYFLYLYYTFHYDKSESGLLITEKKSESHSPAF